MSQTSLSPSRRESIPGRDVAQQAAAVLQESGYSALRSIDCSCEEGILVLSGKVPSFYLKQVAQTLVSKLAEGGQVLNRLDVTRSVPE